MKIYNIANLYAHTPASMEVTLSGSWASVSGSSLYSKEVEVPFITVVDNPFCQATGLSTAAAIEKWGSIVRAEALDGTMTFYSTTSDSTTLNLVVTAVR